jgi:polysaccharide chain length determinant protein (PEP-CTERM system associated)
MLGQRELSFDDYMAILRRRLWVLVIPALVTPVLAFLVTLLLTPDYTSESLILIEQPKVPESFVKSVVTSDLVGRLATMEEQILSRTRLQPIIERYGLYRNELRRGVPMEDVIDEMRKAILVTPVDFANPATPGSGSKKTGGKNETVPGFSISFTAESPRLAQQVCSDLTSMFMEENLRQREQRAQGTTTFLHTQLEEAKSKLDEADAKLADFKRRNIGVLPDEQQTNLQVLGSLNTQLGSVTEDLNRAHQEKIYAESMLNQQLAAWKAGQSGTTGDSQTLTLQQQLTKLQDYLVALEARYTSDHPDVIKTKADIAQLQKEIEEQAVHKDKPAETKPTEASVEPSSVQQLRAMIREVDERIRQKTADQERIQQQINSYQGRLQISPAVEQQFKDITRDYQTALQFYNSLLAKTDESQMSTDLERRQEGEQFQVLDSANLPQEPSFPIWWQFALGGLGAGLLIGLAIILVQELRDKAIRDERDIELYLELETLALVPSLERSNGRKGRIFKRGRKQDVLPQQAVQA